MKKLWQWIKGLFGKVESETVTAAKSVEKKVTQLLPKVEGAAKVALDAAHKDVQLALRKLETEIIKAEMFVKAKL
jgi:hypothetical protein